ncbi:hypothetical protein HD554DRAFT_2173810 [Boletus coccyginus]|nr:hypothetical protein HD554DRAFT_2173810 [Boletus coccyginus]
MRIVFAVPEHREFMQTGTPSEPILAEAAAKLLNETCHLDHIAPHVLSKAFEHGFLAQGERGEMVARLLWTLTHDKPLQNSDDNEEVVFHKPIHLLEFLRNLFHENHLQTVLDAKPVGDKDGPTLSQAFKEAYIHFSHFMDAVDHDIELQQVYQLLLRGAALDCRRNQRSIDFLTLILFGSLHENRQIKHVRPASSGQEL